MPPYPLPEIKILEDGDIILTEFDASYLGYAPQFNQPFPVGEQDKEWQDIFIVAIVAFNNGFRTLKPGITVGELGQAFYQ